MKRFKRLGKIIIYVLLMIFCTVPIYAKNIPNESISTCEFTKRDYFIVLESGVHIRAKAGINSVSLGTMSQGEKVFRISSEIKYANGYYWMRVERVLNGTKGWVASIYLG